MKHVSRLHRSYLEILLVQRMGCISSQKDSHFYVGYTEDIERRFKEHQRGLVVSTKHRRPLTLIHYEYFVNEEDAKAREIFLKSGFGREQLKRSLKRTLYSTS